jgi:hypothetical protein
MPNCREGHRYEMENVYASFQKWHMIVVDPPQHVLGIRRFSRDEEALWFLLLWPLNITDIQNSSLIEARFNGYEGVE